MFNTEEPALKADGGWMGKSGDVCSELGASSWQLCCSCSCDDSWRDEAGWLLGEELAEGRGWKPESGIWANDHPACVFSKSGQLIAPVFVLILFITFLSHHPELRVAHRQFSNGTASNTAKSQLTQDRTCSACCPECSLGRGGGGRIQHGEMQARG